MYLKTIFYFAKLLNPCSFSLFASWSFQLHPLSRCTFSALVEMWIQLSGKLLRRIYLVFQMQSHLWHWVFPRLLLLSRCWFAITPQSNSIPSLYFPQSLPNNDLIVDFLVIKHQICVLEFYFSGIPLLSFLQSYELFTPLVIWYLSLPFVFMILQISCTHFLVLSLWSLMKNI